MISSRERVNEDFDDEAVNARVPVVGEYGIDPGPNLYDQQRKAREPGTRPDKTRQINEDRILAEL